MGCRLAVKDLFDVAGYPTAAGNPVLLAASGLKSRTAPLVRSLLDAGAQFVGKTNTDELAYSLIGDNRHFGMPVNPMRPNDISGGSSSGSAVAVAAQLADIGLGTDTSGSIRLPAAVNGLVGWRPTHGSLDTGGLRPLAPSFDVPGFITASIKPMAAIMDALGLPRCAVRPSSVLIADDILHSVDSDVAKRIVTSIESIGLPVETIRFASSICLDDLASAFVIILQKEAWESNRAFFERHGETVAPDIAVRLIAGSRLDAGDVREAHGIRRAFRKETAHLLADCKLLALPTLAMDVPMRNATVDRLTAFRTGCIRLLCLAGLGGFPQLAFPVSGDGRDFSLSLLGAPDADRMLVEAASLVCRLQ
jgi:amidase